MQAVALSLTPVPFRSTSQEKPGAVRTFRLLSLSATIPVALHPFSLFALAL